MEDDVALVVGIGLDVLVKFNAVGRHQGISLSFGKQVSATRKLEFKGVIVAAQIDSDAHRCLRLLHFHAIHIHGNIEISISIHVSILRRRLLPNDLLAFCQTAHDAEQSHDSQ